MIRYATRRRFLRRCRHAFATPDATWLFARLRHERLLMITLLDAFRYAR